VATSLALLLANNTMDLAQAQARIATFLDSHRIRDDAAYTIRLAVEELVTNIIRYGYDDTLAHRIEISIAISGPAIELRVDDDGHVFDPTAAPPVVAPASMDSAAEGGRGLMLVREMVGPIQYERANGKNRVSLRIIDS
jgi:anti-sigma regulatory factor (Ser/Thr protein kinase)